MKFQCNRNKLTEAVTNVQRAVSVKTTIPALEGILVKCANNKIELFGYDLEICITTEIDATVIEEGSSVIKAKLFSDIIRRMPDDTINIEVDSKNIVYINSGRVDYKIVGLPAEDYPEIPVINSEEKVSIEADTLGSMIRQTIYAVAENDVKPTNKGTLFEIENGTIKMISLDGYRLAMRTEKIDCNTEKSFIVPGKSLTEINRLIPDSNEEKIDIISGTRHIMFKIGNYCVISRLIEGEFINYRGSIPKSHVTELKINTRIFTETIERMSLMLTDKMKSPIRCIIENNEIKTTCNTPLGQANDSLEVMMTGEPIELGFNNKFLLDALRYCETDEIIMELAGATKAIVIKPTEGDSFLFMLMPMRLSK